MSQGVRLGIMSPAVMEMDLCANHAYMLAIHPPVSRQIRQWNWNTTQVCL